MPKTIHFNLENGLEAILHAPKSSETKRLLKLCAKQNYRLNNQLAVEIKIENERVYILYNAVVNTPEHIITQLRNDLEGYMRGNYFMVYNNVAHIFDMEINLALTNAIIKKIKPGVAMLIT